MVIGDAGIIVAIVAIVAGVSRAASYYNHGAAVPLQDKVAAAGLGVSRCIV